MRIKFDWEKIGETTCRAKVIGGWVLNAWTEGQAESMVFIPDPEHLWEVS
jgi:hypothetical protein